MTTPNKIEVVPTCDNGAWEIMVYDKTGEIADDYEVEYYFKKVEAISSAREIFNDEPTIVELSAYDRNYHEYQMLAAEGSLDLDDYKTVIWKREI